ncbi:MAG: hypothetical protein JSW43_12175 [Gemmatimonadota bacterium]|nr:MAG: hypothetical protein JSW43_12175 [Gemmatimonadota bacterium]
MISRRRALLAAGFFVAVTACTGEPSTVLLRAEMHEEPLSGLRVLAYPFDPDRILDSLAARATRPQPRFPELERELAEYQPASDSGLRAASQPWRALRDTVAALSDSLNRMDRRSPAYARMYERFRGLYARLAQRAAERDAALREVNGDHVDLARRAQAAAESLRVWELEAFAAYGEAAQTALQRSGYTVLEVSTDQAGAAELELPRGAWWVIARWTDPHNPFQEYYWNVPLTTSGWLPVYLPLMQGNARRRWRH